MSFWCCTRNGSLCSSCRKKEPPPKVLHVFDFDCTVVVRNSESVYRTAVAKHRGVPETAVEDPPPPVRYDHICQALIDYVTGPCQVPMEDILDCVRTLPFVQGMEECLHRLSGTVLAVNPNARFIVLSGGNDLFIRTKLGSASPPIVPDEVISNRGVLSEDGKTFSYSTHSNQTHCRLCNRALCKGTELELYFETHGRFSAIHFVCDGTNDICPAMRLRQEDTLHVRTGYGLEAMLQRGLVAGLPIVLKARLVFWTNGDDLLPKLLPQLVRGAGCDDLVAAL